DPDYVVVGYAPDLSYRRLVKAATHVRRGARLVATNADALLPVQHGFEVEAGPALAFLEKATGRRAELIGKPDRGIIDLAIERLGVPRERVLIVGDTLETDIAAGEAAGIRTAL